MFKRKYRIVDNGVSYKLQSKKLLGSWEDEVTHTSGDNQFVFTPYETPHWY
jgi:hypothetical protein